MYHPLHGSNVPYTLSYNGGGTRFINGTLYEQAGIAVSYMQSPIMEGM